MNCISYKDEVGCIACKSGYYAKNGNCINAGVNCITLKNGVGCIACESGYYVKNGNCINAGITVFLTVILFSLHAWSRVLIISTSSCSFLNFFS